MNRKTSQILALVMLLVGLGVLTYPTLSDYISRRNGSYAIQVMDAQMANLQRETLEEQRRLARKYNEGLSGTDSGEETAEYEQIMDFGGGVMGSIRIPRIDVELPIYHGASDEVLAKGVGHLPGTAFPIGGEGNHTVLSGHTGLPSAKLFTDLTELEIGDWFYIAVLEEMLAYQVDQIHVVLPGEVQALAPEAGEDYCTLVTCTPYGINSHRLLVRGNRVCQVSQETPPQLPEESGQSVPFHPVLLAAAVGGIGGCIAATVLRRKK